MSEIKWIKVSEKEPDFGHSVLIHSKEGGTAEGMRKTDGTYLQYRWNTKVKATHWCELPKMEEENKMSNNAIMSNANVSTKRGSKPRAMISQAMRGKTKEEIEAQRKSAIGALELAGYEVLNTYFPDDYFSRECTDPDIINKPLAFMAKSLSYMAMCDVVLFCKGWEDARGCRLEHKAAQAYGVEIWYDEG